MDQSTKDVIIGCSPVTDYLNIKTDVSDHNAIIASIQVQSKNQGQRKSRGLTSLCSGIMTISEEKQCEHDFEELLDNYKQEITFYNEVELDYRKHILTDDK